MEHRARRSELEAIEQVVLEELANLGDQVAKNRKHDRDQAEAQDKANASMLRRIFGDKRFPARRL